MTTVRIDETTRDFLRELARETGLSMQDSLAEAVEAYRRRRFLESANADYARLRADPAAWADELAERQLWDATLADGLHDDPYPPVGELVAETLVICGEGAEYPLALTELD